MICQMLLIAAAMQSPQATYYAETCYIKSLTYPIRTHACIESLPERKEEIDARATAWSNKYRPLFQKAQAYLESRQYDFSKGAVPFHVNMATSWARAEQDDGRQSMMETCDAHLADLNS
jgi:hypothetical protein